MANTWFQFRQFRIEQDQCAMKVSTDACLFGAWAPLPDGVRTVLDAGTGTGLLSLMLAQRYPDVCITALEIDPAAAAQARANVAASPFSDRVAVETADAAVWVPAVRYDALICNPPFFHRSLQGPDPARNAARHSAAFDLPQLLQLMERALTPRGVAVVLLPAERQAAWETLLTASGWQNDASLLVRPSDRKAPNRWMGRCSRVLPEAIHHDSLRIYDGAGSYSAGVASLLAPFYPGLAGHEKTGQSPGRHPIN